MRKKGGMTIRIVLLVALLAAIGLFAKDASHQFYLTGYDVAAPIEIKFAKVTKWISPSADLYAVVDVWRVGESPVLSYRLAELVSGRKDLIGDVVRSILTGQNSIGMLMLIGAFGGGVSPPPFAIVAQGLFDEKTLVPTVRSILEKENSRVTTKALGGRTIFTEEDFTEDPFGFIILDREHIAAGSRSALISLFESTPLGITMAGVENMNNFIFFGKLRIDSKIRSMLPPDLGNLSDVVFSSLDGDEVRAVMACEDQKAAVNARMFLEGIRSLVMLQNEGNEALTDMLHDIEIHSEASNLYISADISNKN